MRKVIAAAVFSLVGFLSIPNYSHATKHMVVGDHEVTISGEPYEEKVFIPGGVAYDNPPAQQCVGGSFRSHQQI